MKKIIKISLPTLLLISPTTFVFGQNPSLINFLISEVERVFTNLVPVLVGLALLVFIWGLVLFIFNSGREDGVEKGKRIMVWGVVALFTIISVWGIVYTIQDVFGVTTVLFQPAPQIENPY